jgi:hypothetical protein
MVTRALATLVLTAAAVPALAAIAPPAGIAFNLRPAGSEEPAFRLNANGVQVYECREALTEPGAYRWSFVNPDMTLYDPASGAEAATSRAVNSWNSLTDLSSVSGVLRATQQGGGDNLPWAYFRAIPSSEEGMFAGVTSVQRVNTRGGSAPRDGCNADSAGAEARVPFTAEYYFYKRAGTA